MFTLVSIPVILPALLVAAEAPKELQGEWTVVKVVANDKEDPKAVGDSLILKDDKIIIKPVKSNETIEAKFKTDAGKKPPTIDITFFGPDGSEKTALGLYELDGDSLRLCFSEAGKERPTKIASGKEVMLITLKRKDSK